MYSTYRCQKEQMAGVNISIKGRNGLILEHLDERMELLGHLKVIVTVDITHVKFDRAKQSQTGSRIWINRPEKLQPDEVFSRQQKRSSKWVVLYLLQTCILICSLILQLLLFQALEALLNSFIYCLLSQSQILFGKPQASSSMFFLEGTYHPGWFKRGMYSGCRLWSFVRSVSHELCHLNLKSKLSAIDMIALGTKYHLSCPAALVNRVRQHNNGKVIRIKEKNITANLCYYIRVDFPQTKL